MIVQEYPNQFEARRVSLEAASSIPVTSVEELLANAGVIMLWLSPQHVMFRPLMGDTPQEARGGPQDGLTPTDGQPEPERS